MFIDLFTSDNLPTPGFTLFILLFILLVRFLRILSCNEKPELTVSCANKSSNSKKLERIQLQKLLEMCSILNEK